MKNAVIYARFSSTGQNEQTIDGQIRICREFAEKQGLSVIGIYDKDKAKSASKETEKRKDLHRMFADAETGAFQYIIVYKLDRFARSRNESRIFKAELAKHGVRVLSATENITDDEGGELYEMFLEWNDEKYSQRLSRRVRDGLTTSVENGTFCGGYLIYGYKLRLEPTGKRDKYIRYVEIDEEQAEIVRYAFTEYDKGVEKKDIAAALNAKGLRLNGKPFTGKSFDKWVVNPKYTGEFYFGGRLCDNIYPAIIDKALFERVQKRLNANKYFAGGAATARVPYLLTGKAFCARCETPMVADGGTSHTGKQYNYYACKSAKKRKCEKKREDKDELELFVTQAVYDFLSDRKNAELAVSDTLKYYEQRTGADNLKSIETRIAKAQKDVEQMATAFIEAKNSLLRTTIEKKMTEYEKLIEDLQIQKAQLELERGHQYTKEDLLGFIAELLKGNPSDKDYQRRLIDNLVIKVFVGDNEIETSLRLGSGKDVSEIRLSEVKKAMQGVFGVQTQLPPARQMHPQTNTRY